MTTSTNLTDRLGELVDKVTPGPVFAAAKPSSVVGWPVVAQSGRSVCSMNYIQHSAIDPKISGDDAFNRESKANAEFIALCFTHKDEILSALRKAEQPVSGDYAELAERLRARAFRLATRDFNGDGAKLAFEAATAIERLTAREAELCEALRKIAKGHPQTLGTGKVVNVPLRALDAQRIARLSLGDEK